VFCFFTLKIENTKGELFELTHNTKDYVVADIQGLTRTPTAINTSACAGIDGSFFNSARIEQRNIVIDLILRGDIEGNRQRLYRIFPAKTPCTVYFKNWNRDVKIKGYVETLEGDIFAVREQMRISIICPKPYWQDMQTIYTEMSNIVNRFSFPFSIEADHPIPISAYGDPGCTIIDNPGDVETGFICRIKIASKAKTTLTKASYADTIPEDVLKRYAYIPLRTDQYNPETDTLYITSTVQPSSSKGDRYVIINGVRYLERIYETDQTGATKTLDITRAEGCAAKDLLYYEYSWNNSYTWYTGSKYESSIQEDFPQDLSKAYVEVRGKYEDTLADIPLASNEYEVTFINGTLTVKLLADLRSRNYNGLRIIMCASKNGIDISGAAGILRTNITYKWMKSISWYPCHFENYDRDRDILKVYDGDTLRTDYTITTLTYEDGGTADFIIFNNPIQSVITYDVVKSVSGEDVRDLSDRDIDAGLLLVDHLKIYNRTTGQAFSLDYPFQLDDEIVLNTISGELSVTLHRGGISTNLLNAITGDSTWIKLDVGGNQLAFSADTNADFVYAVFETAMLYGGV
jgi:hypothetical protein